MMEMVEAHTRLQQAVADMNSFRFTATKDLTAMVDIDSLSQQLSQIPADLEDDVLSAISPPMTRSTKRIRVEDTPLRRVQQRVPLSALKNPANITPRTRKSVRLPSPEKELTCSPTQDDESPSNRKPKSSEYGDLIPDENGFSQFDI
jgi:hypothetical protein